MEENQKKKSAGILKKILEKILKKVFEKIKKIMLLLYPELKNMDRISEKSEKKILNKKEKIKLFLMASSPVIIMAIYMTLPLKVSNAVLLGSYILIVLFYIRKEYKSEKRITRKIAVNFLIILIIIFLGIYTVFK